MNLIVGIYAFTALASSLAAVLAWASKLWWAKEYAAAKNETIRAKDAQIELLKMEVQSLRELTPMKLREYFLSVKEQLEEYSDKLREELQTAHEEISRKDSEIHRLLEAAPGVFLGGPEQPDRILSAKAEAMLQDLRATKEQLQLKVHSLEEKLQKEEDRRRSFDELLSISYGADWTEHEFCIERLDERERNELVNSLSLQFPGRYRIVKNHMKRHLILSTAPDQSFSISIETMKERFPLLNNKGDRRCEFYDRQEDE